ncbi:hypothetical protein [Thalassotalea mangrovi]|uniref:DUF3301 domain-containing protein n=1 Tax=Thalassotalea mangrovi TaxID=2572245 RepID=A0A4U1B4B8_9GAMM|nr:hypothetical protein [Thalassotalea mangrovi]TKB45113.1 hypothetical protein E8M12_09795 [Thalassotalea mangrovi]
MEAVLVILALIIISFMVWRLIQARQYNRFVDWLNADIKPQLLDAIEQELIESRCDLTPNGDCHIQATRIFYGAYPIRIFEAALAREIIPVQWLNNRKHKRFAAHLLAAQGQYRVKTGS